MVSAVAGAAPCVQRGPLIVEEGKRSVMAVYSGAGWHAVIIVEALRKIGEKQSSGLVSCIARKLVVHRLSRRKVSRAEVSTVGRTAQAAQAEARLVCRIREQVLPVRYR